jgi:hypothetical protein
MIVRRIHEAISLSCSQCARILDAARPLAPSHRPAFVAHIERKLGESISGVLLLNVIDAPYLGKLQVEVCE